MSSSPSAPMFALIIPLLFLLNSDGGGRIAAPTTASPPERTIAQISPYVPLTEQGFHPKSNGVTNGRAWHAFALVGTETFFASHITNLFMEIHKYQLVIEISLPEPYRSKLIEERKKYPGDSFFLANVIEDPVLGTDESDPLNLPELTAGLRTSFIGNVWHGIPNKPAYKGWPWWGVQPVLSNVPINVKRVVHFVPFSASMNHPDRLSYLLFGAGDEAHLMHIQTMHGDEPDFDHVASLKEAPDWLAADLLEAGAVIDLPDQQRFGDEKDKTRGVRCASPFENGTKVDVRYRGIEPRRSITIGNNKWFCTRIANRPDPCKDVNTRACGSATPKEYLSP